MNHFGVFIALNTY